MTDKSQEIWARPALLLALANLALHALANGRYGFFRDELYFIVCGSRPDFGYVDQPAVVPLLAASAHAIFGDFLWGFRLVPAAVMTATVALTADFARLIGGGRFAQWLAGLAVLLGPIFLLDGVLFSTDMFQPLTWLGLAWVLVRLEQSGDERWWLAFGAIVGFSLNTKYMIGFYVAALAIGLAFTPFRASLRRPWIYLGALLAGVMALPNLLWQQAHGWPFLELAKAAVGGKNIAMSPAAFLAQELLLTGPLAAAVWLCGLWACLVRPRSAAAPALGAAWLLLLVFFAASHGKPYYLTAIYPTLLAFGAGRLEAWIRAGSLRGLALAAVAAAGLATAPLTLPVLPLGVFLRYQNVVGLKPSSGERLAVGGLPQYYADMFGWPEMAAKVASVYRSLPEEERAHAVFFGNNYGEAAAIDVFGRRLGLPAALSGHNNYYLWGPGGHDGGVVLILGGDRAHYAALFRRVDVGGRIDAPFAMPYEAHVPIYVLRGLKTPLQRYWAMTKSYR